MTRARQRLSLLALGILAPVLAFGAIALSGAPTAEATYFHQEESTSDPIIDPTVNPDPDWNDPWLECPWDWDCP